MNVVRIHGGRVGWHRQAGRKEGQAWQAGEMNVLLLLLLLHIFGK